MPDESKAAEEHALMAQITEPLAALPREAAAGGPDTEFPIVLRGYDRLAVDAYVTTVSDELARLRAAHSPDLAVRRALERVGEQISGILQRAHETAAQITTQSREEAEDRLDQARREAEEIVAGARERARELDADVDRIWSERARIVEDARKLGDELMVMATAAADRYPAAGEDPGEAPPIEAFIDRAEDPEAVFAQDAAAEGPIEVDEDEAVFDQEDQRATIPLRSDETATQPSEQPAPHRAE